jgi:hypothetical protein
MRVKDFAAFIIARWNVLKAREQNKPKPWTKDPILQRYRFCNVQREDDTVTRWIADQWRDPNADNPDNWFAMAVARWINWPETLRNICYPVPWKPVQVVKVMKAMRARGEKLWTGAYMIGTQGNAKDKVDFIVDDVLTPMWAKRATYRPGKGDSLFHFNCRLQTAYAMRGGFMGGQVIADIKYTDKFLLEASDWYTFAISGPGSRRGLNRVLCNDVDAKLSEAIWRENLAILREKVLPILFINDIPPLHAQDIQNCLCEFDKYERVRLGQGYPRSTYPGV